MKAQPIFVGTVEDSHTGEALDHRMGHACGSLQSVVDSLLKYRSGLEAPVANKGGLADGGVELAFDITITKLLDRIDRIATDDQLWKLDRGTLRRNRREAVARLNLMEAQSNSVKEDSRPSHKYRVNLSYLDNSQFMAYMNLEDGSVLAGFGRSADEAMKSFDLEWYKHNPEYTPLPEKAPPGVLGPIPGEDDQHEPPKGGGKPSGPQQPPPETSGKTA